MPSRKNTIVNATISVALLAYLIVSVQYCTRQEEQIVCTGMDIRIEDGDKAGFVTPQLVSKWLADSLIRVVGQPIRQVDVYRVERMIAGMPYVKTAQAYTALDGQLHITITQRHPVMRVMTEQGHDFYVDSALTVLRPQRDWTAGVPLVTGNVPLRMEAGFSGNLDEKKFILDRELLYKLVNFVHQVDTDPLLNNLIVQVYFERQADTTAGSDILLLPRIGLQTIRFGPLRTVDENSRRLDKLSRFYRQSLSDGWWETAREIDLKYKDQVICVTAAGTRRTASAL